MATRKTSRATSLPKQRPDAAALWRRLRAALATQGDAAYRTQIERLVPGIRTHGVLVPALRATAKELKSETDATTAAALLDLAAASGNRDELLACCFLLASFGKAARALPWTRIERWLQAVDNWETCDQLAMGLAAPALASSPDPFAPLRTLTKSKNLWHRRFALATAAALNQKGRSFPKETLALCDLLADDREPMVQKALAWARREAGQDE